MKGFLLGYLIIHGHLVPTVTWPTRRLTPAIVVRQISYMENGRMKFDLKYEYQPSKKQRSKRNRQKHRS